MPIALNDANASPGERARNYLHSNCSFTFSPPTIDKDDNHTRALANKILDIYGEYTGPQLSNFTHMPDTPWDNIYRISPRAAIENEFIKSHFPNLSKNRNAQIAQ